VALLKAITGRELEKALEPGSFSHGYTNYDRSLTEADCLLAALYECSPFSAVPNFPLFDLPHRICQPDGHVYRTDYGTVGH